ncbi:MAG TPA: short-chain dehydrogenase, partial [Planctomycetaceae bacterium]|nr:short-chain dehydrogenase [Planctomycetaceae bacterium]
TNMINEQLDAASDRDTAIEGLINASPLAQSYRRMGTPDEIAKAALYLASDATEMVTGTILAIDGGKSLGVPPKRAA